MKAAIIPIGNSLGLRIPKAILKQCGFEKEVELEVQNKHLIVKSSRKARQNWETAFQKMHKNQDHELIEFPQNRWDEEEWEW